MHSYASAAGTVGVESAPCALVNEAANADTLAQASLLIDAELDTDRLADAEALTLTLGAGVGGAIGYEVSLGSECWVQGHFGTGYGGL